MSMDNLPPEENPERDQYENFRDQYDDEIPSEDEPKAKGNRTFLTIVGVIVSVVILAVIALVAYSLISKGQLTNRFQEQAAQINAENTATAMVATQDAVQELARMTEKAMLPPTWTPTGGAAQVTPATSTPKPTNTTAPTATTLSGEARTATVVVFLTQSGGGAGASTQIAQITNTPTSRVTSTIRTTTSTTFRTPTALPTTGFADEVGLPGLFGLAVVLFIVVVLARRFRLSTNR